MHLEREAGESRPDETYIGRKKGVQSKRAGWGQKMCVISLVDRDTGVARSFHAKGTTKSEVAKIVWANFASEATLTTDEAHIYKKVGRIYAGHDTVFHGAGEYVNLADRDIHTNTIEGL